MIADTLAIERLPDTAVVRQLDAVIVGLAKNRQLLHDLDPDCARFLLANVAEALDGADETGCFGSDGWRDLIDG